MKKLLIVFIGGLVLGALGYRYVENFTRQDWRNAGQKVSSEAGKVKSSIQEKIGDIRLEDIKEELARTGMVVREKARQAGEIIADATADARVTAAIKAKYLKEQGLASMNIHVSTSEGLVTLSGTVGSAEEIAQAVRLALETDGVHKVVSTLQIKAERR